MNRFKIGDECWFIGYQKEPKPNKFLQNVLFFNKGKIIDLDDLHAVVKTDNDDLFIVVLEKLFKHEYEGLTVIMNSEKCERLM